MVARALRWCGAVSAVAAVAQLSACRAPTAPGKEPNALLGLPIGAYQAVDLGTLGGLSSSASDVNIRNQVVGTSATADGFNHAFLWQAGLMTDLGTLGGTTSGATELNDIGQVVGWSSDATEGPHAFLWTDGSMQDLGPLGLVGQVRLNARGQVAWTAYPAGDVPHRRAVLWSDGVAQELGTLGDTGWSQVYALNDLGQVVGASNGRPVLWENGVMRELPGLGGGGWASAINDLGQIVGASYQPVPGDPYGSILHALLWDGDQTIELGKLPEDTHSAGSLINQTGMVIVQSFPFSWSYPRDFLWTAGQMTRLTPLNWRYTANGLNELGVVAGTQDSTFTGRYAVVWEQGQRSRLPLLNGVTNFSSAINNAGTIVGGERLASTSTRAVLWRKSFAALTAAQ